MKLILLTLSLLWLAEARINNKYSTDRKKHQDKYNGGIEHDGDVQLEDNGIHSGITKVKGHGITKVKGHVMKDKGHHDNGHGHHENGHGHHDNDHLGERDHGHGHGHHDGKDHDGEDHGHGHHGNHGNVNHIGTKKDVKYGKWKMKKSQNKHLLAVPGKKDWRKRSYKHQDVAECEKMRCRRKQVCVLNEDTGLAECISRKALRQRKRMAKHSIGEKSVDEDNMKKKHQKKSKLMSKKQGKLATKKADMTHKKAHRMAKKIKHKAERFQHKYDEKKRHRFHRIQDSSEHVRSSPIHNTNSLLATDTPRHNTHCTKKDLSEMGRRLLDWFKLIQDQSLTDHSHYVTKRNSQKKELHEKDECICQSPARSEFLRLDTDHDDTLSQSELHNLESNGYEHCIQPFIESCDHDHDDTLSDKEWCCCFAAVLPPCLAEMTKVPAAVSLEEKTSIMPGAFVPQCDEDGFYQAVQCHGSTGYCWCVDRHGVKIEGSHTRGTPTCGAEKELDATENQIEMDVFE